MVISLIEQLYIRNDNGSSEQSTFNFLNLQGYGKKMGGGYERDRYTSLGLAHVKKMKKTNPIITPSPSPQFL